MLKVLELDLSKSEYRADSSFPKGVFLLPKDEETDFLGRSKYARRDQRGKTGLQNHRRRNLKRSLL